MFARLHRRSYAALAAVALLFLSPKIATAAEEIDTEQLFGFLIGTDIGERGEREIESETSGQFGKGAGSYSALSQKLSLEYTPNKNLRLEFGGSFTRYSISGVPGLDDARRTSLQELSFEVRQRLLDRDASGIGLTLLAEPHLGFMDDTTGEPVNRYGSAFALLLDKEIAPSTIGALNLFWQPDVSRSRLDGAWSRTSTWGVGTGAMTKIVDKFFMGGEARYLRAYDSLLPRTFQGDAFYLGPAAFWRPAEKWRVTAAWSTQIAGHSVEAPSRLDLVDFARHQVTLRIGREF
jgi:hypothetical protein